MCACRRLFSSQINLGLCLTAEKAQEVRPSSPLTPPASGRSAAASASPTKQIDITLIQSLVRNGEVRDLVGDYGHLIVDECHHLSAASLGAPSPAVEGLVRARALRHGCPQGRVRPIIFMQRGPVRYGVAARSQVATPASDVRMAQPDPLEDDPPAVVRFAT